MKHLPRIVVVVIILILLYGTALLVFVDPNIGLELDRHYILNDTLRFGREFLWGAATSAYQVEGNCTNSNWWEFESTVDRRGLPRIKRGQRSGIAADHWRRYKEDVQLLKEMHLNAYRFSIEWSKIEPEEGVFADSALDHYEQVIDELRANGIEPFITLHHFTNPLWFERKGGFEREDSPEILARFARKVVARLGRKVRFWTTVNEPNVYALEGYYSGTFPPGQQDPARAIVVFRNLLRAHTACYLAIKEADPKAQVGLPISVFIIDPAQKWNLLDVSLAHYLNEAYSVSVLDYLTTGMYDLSLPGIGTDHYESGIPEAFDFVGLNYYSRIYCHYNPFGEEKIVVVNPPLPAVQADNGWEIYKEGLIRALYMIASRTGKPIYITENGIADDSDQKRATFIEDHVLTTNRAIFEKMNVRGYFYWSLMDNFEWTEGFDKRFGLYAVDFATQKRTVRQGSLMYKKLVMTWARRLR